MIYKCNNTVPIWNGIECYNQVKNILFDYFEWYTSKAFEYSKNDFIKYLKKYHSYSARICSDYEIEASCSKGVLIIIEKSDFKARLSWAMTVGYLIKWAYQAHIKEDKEMAALQMRKAGPKISLSDNNIDIDKLINENSDKVVEIPLEELEAFTYKGVPQAFGIREEEVKVLSESMNTYGQLTPCAVRPYKNNYQIISGHKRFAAAKALGLTVLKCIIFDCGDENAFELVKHYNIQRDKPKPSEIMELVAQTKELKKSADKDGELTVTEIAEMFDVSRKHIYRCYSLRNLPKAIHNAVDNEQIGTNDIEKIINHIPAEHLAEFSDWVEYESSKISSGKLNKIYEWSDICVADKSKEFSVDSINKWLDDYKSIKADEAAEEDAGKEIPSTERGFFIKLRVQYPALKEMADSEIFSLIDEFLSEYTNSKNASNG